MPSTKTASFGSCSVSYFSPEYGKIKPDTKVLNIKINFEEALKLNLALNECLLKLNKYNRSTKSGKRAAAKIAVHISKKRITIVEGII